MGRKMKQMIAGCLGVVASLLASAAMAASVEISALEGGVDAYPKVFKVQMRPDPLAH